MIKLALIILAALVILFFTVVFVIALIATIKEMRRPKPIDLNGNLGFSGDLGVKLIKKAQTIPQ